MAGNTNLSAAKTAKNDEFYTQYSDIEAEMNAYVEYNPDVFRGKKVTAKAAEQKAKAAAEKAQDGPEME